MLRGFLAILNVVVACLTVFSAYSSFINPNSIWQFSFAGLLFPAFAIINMIFTLFWMLRKRWLFLISTVTITLCYPQLSVTFACHFFQNSASGELKIMTWNVKNFDLYNWTGNVETRRKMLDFIKSESPDVLCIQEFYSDQGVIMNNLAFLRDTLGYLYIHFEPTVELDRIHCNHPIHQQWGEATFSKFPIIQRKRLDFKNSRSNDCIYSDILYHSDTIRVFNMHLQSIHLDEEDYRTLQQMEKNQLPDWVPLKRILNKMKYSYQIRSSQIEQVAKVIRRYSGHQIICCDLNDVPVSYAYQTITRAKNLKDAFIEKGWGIGRTFIAPYSIFRIDYIFTTQQIHVVKTVKANIRLSDHYPVIAELSLK
jgi:endonuclease/exonuclease/phosphatase family metal-dependent hydrolase